MAVLVVKRAADYVEADLSLGAFKQKKFFHDQNRTLNWLSAITICYYLLVSHTAAKSKQSKTSQNHSPDDIQNMK